eukprot:7136816-Prymnesium_polylepis.1
MEARSENVEVPSHASSYVSSVGVRSKHEVSERTPGMRPRCRLSRPRQRRRRRDGTTLSRLATRGQGRGPLYL